MKKILFALCLAALVVTGCDPKKKHYVGNDTNYGVFQFAQSELVVDVTEDVTSFRLEGSYKVQPDKDAYGDIWLYLDAKQTTAKHPEHFTWTKYVKFQEDENGVLYYDVKIHPEAIDKELYIVYHTKTVDIRDDEIDDSVLQDDSKIKITLRPAAN